eukprot:Gb_01421 [translate_table: standard]
MCVKCVLVALHTTTIEEGLIRSHSKSHSLVLYCASSVDKRNVLGNESLSHSSEGCRIECCCTVYNVFAPSNHSIVHAVSNKHQICLLFAHINILDVVSFLHLNNVSSIALVGSIIHCLLNRFVVSSPVGGHDRIRV